MKKECVGILPNGEKLYMGDVIKHTRLLKIERAGLYNELIKVKTLDGINISDVGLFLMKYGKDELEKIKEQILNVL